MRTSLYQAQSCRHDVRVVSKHAMTAQPLRLVGKLALCLSLVALSASSNNTQDPARPQDPAAKLQEPRSIALQSWNGYLEQIGWQKEMRERFAPRLLGTLTRTEDNVHGGKTMTYDGSRPGLRATVTLVLGADGKPVVAPEVQFADVLEAR